MENNAPLADRPIKQPASKVAWLRFLTAPWQARQRSCALRAPAPAYAQQSLFSDNGRRKTMAFKVTTWG